MHVAFFRNLNQGQRGQPSSTQLVQAFVLAGAQTAAPFQSNGTVVFEAANPDECVRQVLERLATASPWRGVAFVRNAEWVIGMLDALSCNPTTFRRSELSLFDEATSPVALPLVGARCVVVSSGAGYAITENDRDAQSNATPTLEAALGIAVTSRGLPTLSRLAERLRRT